MYVQLKILLPILTIYLVPRASLETAINHMTVIEKDLLHCYRKMVQCNASSLSFPYTVKCIERVSFS